MTQQPEPCIKDSGRCYSPTACGSFGYCRDRNVGVPAIERDARLRNHWQRLALARKRMEELLERIAGETNTPLEEVRAYVIEHAAEIFGAAE